MTGGTVDATTRRRWNLAMASASLAVFAFLGLACGGGGGGDLSAPPWSVTQRGTLVEIAYGAGTNYPQYAALHTDSSYFRMVYSREGGWGTSVILLPVVWESGHTGPTQGAPLAWSHRIDGADLILDLTGTIAGLAVTIAVRISPPAENALTARVSVQTSGSVALENRPGEAFKPVMLSSMHVSENVWDASSAFAGSTNLPIPPREWIVTPPLTGTTFGLYGGTSSWKTNAPTIEVQLDRTLEITGWVTETTDQNADNVGFWAASSEVLPSWSYTIVARP